MKIKASWALGLLLLTAATRGAEKFDIEKQVEDSKVIPVAMSGFTGEIASVIKFDLEVVGFQFVDPDSADYLITGSNTDHVLGRLLDRVSKAQRLGREYTGTSLRRQAHAFADDIVKFLRGIPGIAQTKIAFRVQQGGAGELYIADYDGANAMPITRDHALVAAPCWAPDRRTIYYTSYLTGFPEIYMQELSSGDRKAVARNPGLNTSPAISPDGQMLAMILSWKGSPDLWVARRDGTDPLRLTITREDESSPCWSPDSRTICFVSRKSGLPQLYTIPAHGGTMTRLKTGVGSATQPSWSPDGKNILFTALSRPFQIYMVPPSGELAEPIVAGEDPAWGPNSRTAIFTRRDKYRPILSLLDVPTKRVKDVRLNFGSCSQPAWAK